MEAGAEHDDPVEFRHVMSVFLLNSGQQGKHIFLVAAMCRFQNLPATLPCPPPAVADFFLSCPANRLVLNHFR
jgi:hypothetical protein